MRFLPIILILLALDLYTYQAVRTVVQNQSSTVKWTCAILFWIVPVIAIGYMFFGGESDTANWKQPGQVLIRAFIFGAYISKLMVAGPLLIDDARRLFLFIYDKFSSNSNTFNYSRNKFLSRTGLILGGIPFTLLSYGIIRNPYRYKVFKETVSLKNLPKGLDGLKIVQISDVHSGSFTFKEPVKNAIDLINQQDADLVFFTGDLVNDLADEMDHYMDVFDKIRAKYGVFSVLGNHDYGEYVRWDSKEEKAANMEKMKNVHRQLGWDLLINENRILDINNEKVSILGVENYSMKPRFPRYGDLSRAHSDSGPSNYLKLLLSHDPSHWEGQVLPGYKDIDITFSGHTHGMQFGVEIPGVIKWSPIKFLYKQWAGLYQEGEQYLYVNRGLGFLGYPGRVGILPEITLLELKSA